MDQAQASDLSRYQEYVDHALEDLSRNIETRGEELGSLNPKISKMEHNFVSAARKFVLVDGSPFAW
jgi:hypothetical protein